MIAHSESYKPTDDSSTNRGIIVMCQGSSIETITNTNIGRRSRHFIREREYATIEQDNVVPVTEPRQSISEFSRYLANGILVTADADIAAVYVGTVHPANYLQGILHWHGLPARWKIQRLHEMWFDGGIPLITTV